jgi:hypothetical protein
VSSSWTTTPSSATQSARISREGFSLAPEAHGTRAVDDALTDDYPLIVLEGLR